MQHFNEPQKAKPVENAPLMAQAVEQKGDGQTNVFAFLSLYGQQAVGEYVAHLEQGLAKSDFASKALSTWERDDALREIQNHLASLIVAYQELGDDEPKAIRSAIAQFGAARDVSTGLRRAERRRVRVAVGPEIVVPLFFFSLALITPIIVIAYSIPLQWVTWYKAEPHRYSIFTDTLFAFFGWPALILLPFLAGAFAGSKGGKQAWRGLWIAALFALGTTLLLNLLFIRDSINSGDEQGKRMFSEIQTVLAAVGGAWIVSAGLGVAFARGVRALRRKGKVA